MGCFSLAYLCATGQTPHEPMVEAASIRLASPNSRGIACTGGPGTADPLMWRCSNVSVSFLIAKAYGYQPYQFDPANRCCQTRVDLAAKVPPGTTRAQFQRMQQNLLVERFQLKVHLQPREMAIYEVRVSDRGIKMRRSPGAAVTLEQDPWGPPKYRKGNDGYPEFLPGQQGVASLFTNYRWMGTGLSMEDIVRTLSAYSGRPVVDLTGLTGRYTIDIKWSVDPALPAGLGGESDGGTTLHEGGPSLQQAVLQGLGLKMNSKRGSGDVVVVDHIEKVPAAN